MFMEDKEYTVKSYKTGISLLADFLRQIPNEEFSDIVNSCNLDYHPCATKEKIIGVLLEKMMDTKRKSFFC